MTSIMARRNLSNNAHFFDAGDTSAEANQNSEKERKVLYTRKWPRSGGRSGAGGIRISGDGGSRRPNACLIKLGRYGFWPGLPPGSSCRAEIARTSDSTPVQRMVVLQANSNWSRVSSVYSCMAVCCHFSQALSEPLWPPACCNSSRRVQANATVLRRRSDQRSIIS